MAFSVRLVNGIKFLSWLSVASLVASGYLANGLESEPISLNPPQAVIKTTAIQTLQPAATITPGLGPQSTTTPPLQTVSDDSQTLRPVLRLTPANLGLPEVQAGSKSVNIGIFLTVRDDTAAHDWSETDAAERIQYLIAGANVILAQCKLHLALETAQVVALPERLLRVQGNEVGSWGGHPPNGTENVELFNYRQNERLTADTRELFAYGKQNGSPNAIALFTVEHITYYAEQQLTGADSLSFPPNVYHHSDDYPLRNSVLLVEDIPPGSLPTVDEFTMYGLSHEIGHMLLNSGDHKRDRQNLMASLGGVTLTAEQCERMHHNLDWLYGNEAVPDPGPPTEP